MKKLGLGFDYLGGVQRISEPPYFTILTTTMCESLPANQFCERCSKPLGKCENCSKVFQSKITVFGDSWLRLQILPEVTFARKKRKYQASLDKAGASRVFEMIHAAIVGTEQKSKHSICRRYIPQDPHNQILATNSLQEYDADKDFVDILRLIGLPEAEIANKVFRTDQYWGAKPCLEVQPEYNRCLRGSSASGKKYWVIIDDCLYNRNTEDYTEDSEYLYKTLKQQHSESSPAWILWSPERFGNDSLHSKNKVCEETLILGKEDAKITDKTKEIKEKTIVFLRVSCLTDAGIGQRGDSSIEECLEGILDAIEKDKHMKRLAGCAAVIIENGVDSAFLIKLDEQGKVTYCQSFFRRNRIYEADRQGIEFVRGGLLVASCLNALIKAEEEGTDINSSNIAPYLAQGIKDGLWRMLLHFHFGLPVVNQDDLQEYFQKIYKLPSLSEFLKKHDAEQSAKQFLVYDVLFRDWSLQQDGKCVDCNYAEEKKSATYMSRVLRSSNRPSFFLPPWLLEKQWDELQDPIKESYCYEEPWNFTTKKSFLDAIVRCGLKVLSEKGKIKFPFARFGEMVVVDPEEISMFRRLQNLMQKYIDSNDNTPLGLAVFGSPGLGKSFGVKEVAKTVTKKELNLIECNLSQLSSADDLYRTLLEARNGARKGQPPIIFLDEFDSPLGEKPFGWFKYLLAVLQDGTFRFDGTLFDIGKAFIVCAGGQNRSFQEFEWKSRNMEFRNTKIPDLISRLRGHVNIKGPNPYFPYPSESEPYEKGNQPFQVPMLENYESFLLQTKKEWKKRVTELAEKDPLYRIRRAIILRGLLKKKMPFIHDEENELDVGPRVLRALLDIPEYKYGTRSIEAIIDMSVSVYRDSRRFTKAMIPPPEQLEMHVDAEEFYRIMEES